MHLLSAQRPPSPLKENHPLYIGAPSKLRRLAGAWPAAEILSKAEGAYLLGPERVFILITRLSSNAKPSV